MAKDFAQKFEDALQEKRRTLDNYGLRTIARELAGDEKERVETIRRRLNKYRPKPGGGAAEVTPTRQTRREIERAMGLPVDALEPDEDLVSALSPAKQLAVIEAKLRAVRELFWDVA